MSIFILGKRPDQARDYVGAFERATKKNGYYEVSDHRLFPGNSPVYLT